MGKYLWTPTKLPAPTNGSFKRVVPKMGGEAEMGDWEAIGDPVNNYISVVLLTLSDQMS